MSERETAPSTTLTQVPPGSSLCRASTLGDSMTSSELVARFAPLYTKRRLALNVAKSAVKRPTRLRHRLNRGNLQLHRFFDDFTFTCTVCGHVGTAFFDLPDRELRREHNIGLLRETLNCRSCGCTMRDRTLATALLDWLGNPSATAAALPAVLPSDVRIFDTDAHSALSKRLSTHPAHVRSQFLTDVPNGAEIDGPSLLNVDLEAMHFADESFDVLLTSDVMEHVRDYRAAHAEIARVLAPGGAYIFTAPFNADLERHRTLIDTSTDIDIPLEELHVHGDPVDGGIKAYRVYGRELYTDLEGVGLVPELRMIDDAEHGIFGGDVFVARKPKAS
jgi:SAM-dependent methyltransferase